MTQDRPNIVFIITDQQRADWLGCAGHPVVKTPNIDALAATGTRFTEFHAAAPICQPNRASLMTGRMPSQHGLRYNGLHLPTNATTFVDVLAAEGYDTAAIGKSHLQPFTRVPAPHPKDPDDLPPRPIAEAWAPRPRDYDNEQPKNYEGTERYAFPASYYGFTHVDMCTNHGDRCGGHYAQWFRQQRSDHEALWDRENEMPHNYSCPQAFRTPVPEELYPTTWVADRAIDYLADPARAEAPFFAFVSFPDPHHPFNPPGKYWDMYDPDDFEITLPYAAHQNPTPPMQFVERAYHEKAKQFSPQTVMRCSDRQLQEAMALTAGMITMIDDQVGRIVAALKANGQYENTIICFTSDHGDYLGDFGMLLKGIMPFASVSRVPMIWSDPADRSARETATMASTVDVGPSILDRIGVTPYRGVTGRSFLPTLRDGAPHRTEVLIEQNDSGCKLGFPTPARMRTLRSAEWRFTIYAGEDWGELYDLRADPSETHNLWDSPDHAGLRGELALALAHKLTGLMDESPRSELLA